jgi:hypothetical protein
MKKSKLTESQIDALCHHPGYGIGSLSAQKVKQIIIGNESGIGNADSIEEFMQSHLRESKEIAEVSRAKRINSPFLHFISRITRALENKSGNWFAPKDQCDVYDQIVFESFYSESTHLVDIRPLPRPNESVWPYEGIDEKLYVRGFRNMKSKDEAVQNLIDKKTEALRKQILSYTNLEVIIAPGAAWMKRKFLENLFPGIQFKTHTIETPIRKLTYLSSEYYIDGRKVKIVVTAFFDSKNGIGYEGLRQLFELISENKL